MRLFHIPGSRSTRVLWTLQELGAPYEVTLLDRAGKNSPEHRERHPLGRVPVLELDDGQTIFESAAICLQLADMYPDAGLLPAPGSTARALAYQWTVFAMAELEPAVFGLLGARRAGGDETTAAERVPPVLAALQQPLVDSEWLLGDTFTVPDVFIASIVGTVIRRELGEPGPVLRAYVERALARPANVAAEAVGRAPASNAV
jgi:glutathione S-transferase